MKSEHRHDLQTNELGKVVERFGSFMEVHGNRLMIGVFVVALAAAVAIFWVNRERAKSAAAWQEFAFAVNLDKPDEFHDVWQKYKGTPVGLWAAVHEGEGWLSVGVQNMFRNVETATGELEKARDAFQNVVSDRSAPAEIRERALIGLAHALESLSNGNESEAIQAYETLLKEFPDSVYKEEAQDRLTDLKKHGDEFYSWFSKYPRPTASEKRPQDKGAAATDDDLDLAKELEKLGSGSKRKKVGDEKQAGSPRLPDESEPASEEKPADESDDTKKASSEEGADSKSKPDDERSDDGESDQNSKADESSKVE